MTDRIKESHYEELKQFYQGIVVTESQSAEMREQPERDAENHAPRRR